MRCGKSKNERKSKQLKVSEVRETRYHPSPPVGQSTNSSRRVKARSKVDEPKQGKKRGNSEGVGKHRTRE